VSEIKSGGGAMLGDGAMGSLEYTIRQRRESKCNPIPLHWALFLVSIEGRDLESRTTEY
jgi:hypothetical protein